MNASRRVFLKDCQKWQMIFKARRGRVHVQCDARLNGVNTYYGVHNSLAPLMGSFISAQLGITDAKLCLGGPGSWNRSFRNNTR